MAVITKAEPQEPSIPKNQAESAEAKEAALVITSARRRTAWQVHRWPTERRMAKRQVRVHFPRSYLSKDGIDVRLARAGTDLNLFIYRHYENLADEKDIEKTNFVSAERIKEKKHEFLGPDPRVVGFSYDYNGDVHICWHDRYLDEQWVDDKKWTVLEVEKSGKAEWVEKDPS